MAAKPRRKLARPSPAAMAQNPARENARGAGHDEAPARGFARVDPFAPRENAFRQARRHSRTVRTLKWLLPVLAALVAGLFVFYSWRSIPPDLTVVADASSVSDGRLVMANPKLDGFTKADLPYSMIAARATQLLGDSNVIDLDEINARLPLGPDLSAVVKAARGTYDRLANVLVINGGTTMAAVSIDASDGTGATMQNIRVDVAASLFQATGNVAIHRGNTAITAEALAVSEGGKLLVFDGQVRMTVQPDRAKAAEGEDGDAKP